ncbi:MAG: hypothetical protein L3J57_01800 [Desulfuromusa sp.]|nr:hypothetical protein [Desulfuromusa sp.]
MILAVKRKYQLDVAEKNHLLKREDEWGIVTNGASLTADSSKIGTVPARGLSQDFAV